MDPDCSDGFLCPNKEICLKPYQFCNDRQDCDLYEKGDEHYSEDGHPCNLNNNKVCTLPNDQIHKKDILCMNGTFCDKGFLCKNGQMCIPAEKFCDGRRLCNDRSDEIYRNTQDLDQTGIVCRRNERYCILEGSEIAKKNFLCDQNEECDKGFFCSNGGMCVAPENYCNGHADCSDAGDEKMQNFLFGSNIGIPCLGPLNITNTICLLPKEQDSKKDLFCKRDPTCTDGFLCLSGEKCLPPHMFCDGREDCRDGSDEVPFGGADETGNGILCRQDRIACLLPGDQKYKCALICQKSGECEKDEFACADKISCIPLTEFCDGKENCQDGSDEVRRNFTTSNLGVPCRQYDAVCILPVNQSSKVDSVCLKNTECNEDEFACMDGSQCIHSKEFCNGFELCIDGSDEIRRNLTDTTLSGRPCRQYNRYICLLPEKQSSKAGLICRNDTECGSDKFACKDGTECISNDDFCDGHRHCNDLSDEIYWNASVHRTGIPCRQYDHICLLPEDQANKNSSLCTTSIKCHDDEFTCKDGTKCIAKEFFCDYHSYSLDGCSDKSHAIIWNSTIHTSLDGIPCRNRYKIICLLPLDQVHKKKHLCSGNATCTENEFPCIDGSRCIEKIYFCDGYKECGDGSDEIPFSSNVSGLPCRHHWETCLLPLNHEARKEYLCKNGSACNDGFTCGDGKCIRPNDFCDGWVTDCSDGSDEIYANSSHNSDDLCRNTSPKICVLPKEQEHKRNILCNRNVNCDEDEFKCVDDSKCLYKYKFCDSYKDCSDGSDEIRRNFSSNYNASFACRKYYRICHPPPKQEHKFIEQCRSSNMTCEENEIPCRDGSGCIDADRFCSWDTNCEDGSDEVRIAMNSTGNLDGILCRSKSRKLCLLPSEYASMKDIFCPHPIECGDGEFTCKDGSGCVAMNEFCRTSDPICYDGSDQMRYNKARLQEGEILCDGNDDEYSPEQCLLPREHICDNKTDCVDGIDECLCNKGNKDSVVFLDSKCFRCPGKTQVVIPVSKLCDGVFDCPNLADECMCNKKERLHACQKLIGDTKRSMKFTCTKRPGKRNGKRTTIKLNLGKICDKMIDCDDASDENHCTRTQNADQSTKMKEPSDEIRTLICHDGSKSIACDGQPECKEDIMEEECECTTKPRFCQYLDDISYTSGSHQYGDHYYSGSPVYQFRCSDNKQLDGPQVCDGKFDCPLQEDEFYCNHRFYCNSGSVVHIEKEKVCDQVPDCDDHSDEIRESGCSFACNDGGDVQYVDLRQVCDGFQNCAHGADECQENCINSAFSDTKLMIKNKGVLSIVWIISVTALFGNIFVAIISLRDLALSRRKSGSLTWKINNALILNLSISDLLVALYTMSICIQNSLFDGKYCLVDADWRTGNVCSGLGVILMIGSEESVFTMILITIFKMICIWRPSAIKSVTILWFVVACTWIVSMTFALLPIASSLEDYFVDSIWYSDNRLFTSIERSEVSYFINWMIPMYAPMNTTHLTRKYDSWKTLEDLVSEMFPGTTPNRKYGFYSTHTVCLPTLFPNKLTDTAWWYSLIIILFNFLAFCLMLFGYMAMYRRVTRQQDRAQPESVGELSSRMQRKLTRILVTDFCCWMPVCIAAFLQLSGINIPYDAYLPFGLIVIPINSALNPFLYSNVPDIIWTKLRPVRSWLLLNCAQTIFRTCHINLNSDQPTGNTRHITAVTHGETLGIFSNAEDEDDVPLPALTAETRV